MIKHQPNDMVKYQQYIRRKWLVLLVMVILAVIASLASLMAGSAGLTLKEVVLAVFGNGTRQTSTIVWNVRMPCYVWVHHAKCVTQSVGVRIYIGGISRSILWRCGVDYLSGSRNAGQYWQRFCCLSYYYQSGNGDILRLFGWSSNNGSDSGVVPATRCHTICYGTGRCCNQLHVQRWNDISTIFCG